MNPLAESCGDRSPLPGLLVGGVVVLLAQIILFLADWTDSPSSTTCPDTASCAYEVFEDSTCLGTVFCEQPENISAILQKLGRSDGGKWTHLKGCVPCGSSIRLGSNCSDVLVGSIPGARLMAAGRKIDLNRAQEADLSCIPGIGSTLAARIVKERTRKNGFKSLEELRSIPGIGEKKWQILAQWLKVEPSAAWARAVSQKHDLEQPRRLNSPGLP